MAFYKVLFKPSAIKQIEAIPKKDRYRILHRIQSLSSNPRPLGCLKLVGEDKYRLRQGRYRIVYSVADQEQTVSVVKVGHRGEIYRSNY